MADENKNPYSLREIFQSMELHLISALKRTFFRHKNEELKEGFEWEQWQLAKLRNIEKFRNENKKIIGKYSDPIQKTIDDVLEESFNAGENRVEKAVQKNKDKIPEIDLPKDIKPPSLDKKTPEGGMEPLSDILPKVTPKKEDDNIPSIPVGKPKSKPEENKPQQPKNNPPPQETNFFGMNDKKLKALTDSVKHDIVVAQHSVLRKMDDVYRQTIFKTQVFMQSGATSLNQAIDMATKDFLDKGINSIVYKDGKRVNIASYAEMALRTASQRATFLGEGKKRDEWGMHLVVVSAHANTCKLCLPWQGKILIDDVFSHGTKEDGPYPLLSEAMKAGLLH